MKKTLFSIILLAALTVSGKAQVNVDANYSSDFIIRGTNRAQDAAVVGISAVKNIKEGLNAYAFNYFATTATSNSQNHSGIGLAQRVEAGEFSFTADLQGVYHLADDALDNSLEWGIGVTFDSLPVISKYVDVSVYYWDDTDLDLNGVELKASKTFSDVLVAGLDVTPAVGAFLMNDYDAHYAQLGATYTAVKFQPYALVRYIDNDAAGSLAISDDTQVSVGLKFDF